MTLDFPGSLGLRDVSSPWRAPILGLFSAFIAAIFWKSLSKIGVNSSLEKAMAPHSSTLAWKIPWTEEPGGLQSMGSLSQD